MVYVYPTSNQPQTTPPHNSAGETYPQVVPVGVKIQPQYYYGSNLCP